MNHPQRLTGSVGLRRSEDRPEGESPSAPKKRINRSLAAVPLALLLALAASLASTVGATASAGAASGTPLVGTFQLSPGTYTTTASGSYFRMLDAGGKLNGPDSNYFSNPSSSAKDQTYTLLTAGTQGGLVTGAYQPPPNPAFSGENALAHSIAQPTSFTGINFSIETESPDPQTSTKVPTPTITDTGGKLTGKTQAFSASWSNQYFNQGSPKPDGKSPSPTTPVSGTYNSKTGAYTLTWASLIQGGPFNGFTGQWFLSGTFHAKGTYFVTNTSLPGATKGTAYSDQLYTSGGKSPYTWSATGLPAGLSIKSSTGLISGKPTAGAGTFTVKVSVKDGASAKATTSLKLVLKS
jgi:Putative Ig domain